MNGEKLTAELDALITDGVAINAFQSGGGSSC